VELLARYKPPIHDLEQAFDNSELLPTSCTRHALPAGSNKIWVCRRLLAASTIAGVGDPAVFDPTRTLERNVTLLPKSHSLARGIRDNFRN
jgi:hypothetical protein